MMRFPCSQVEVTAVRAGPAASGGFVACTAVGRTTDGRMFELARTVGTDFEGVEFSEAEALGARQANEWTDLPTPAAAQPRVVAWVVAEDFAELVRQAFEAAKAGACQVKVPGGSVFLVSAPNAAPVRAEIHDAARSEARQALARRDGPGAATWGTRAWLVAQAVEPLDVALLVAGLRSDGRGSRGDAIRRLEARARGPAFEQVVEQHLATLGRRDNQRARLREMQRTGIDQSLEQLRSAA